MHRHCLLAVLSMGLGLTAAAEAKELPHVSIEKFTGGLVAPITMIPYGEGAQANLLVDQTGVISFVGDDGKLGGTFLDLRSKMVELKPKFDERGAIGIALHPKFKENGKV